ncbi:MAG: hypothetical protein UHK60_11750 [Acutalibacteraceae bacterium]|nr:hypothetical protein [Acutalibacteraceae bacterium]
MKKKIYAWEPYFFMFFGLFHLHRIWGLIDRKSYANFWVGLMESKGIMYFVVMILLASLCIVGIITFCKNKGKNYWWRWIYIFGGSYVLFDLFAIAIGLEVWNKLILMMYDINAPYWNVLWLAFILLGGFAFTLGVRLLVQRKR